MDWTNELFVRLYVRDSADWKVLPWQARCLLPLLLRRVDRAGVLETRHGVKGVAALVDLPIDVVEPGLAALLEDGSVTQHDRGYLLPNFIEAQESNKSDKARAKEYRDKRRAKALADVTPRDATVTPRDVGVTPHHAASHGVTLRREETRGGETRIDKEKKAADEPLPVSKQRTKRAKAPPNPGHQRMVDRWSELFEKRYGAKPTWSPKAHGIVKRLLEAHGYAELAKRAEKLLFKPPHWLKGGVDLGTLSTHFDKLVEMNGRPFVSVGAEEDNVLNLEDGE